MRNFTQVALDASAGGSVNSDSHGVDIDTTPLPPGIVTKGEHSIGVVSSEGNHDAMNNDNDQPSSREIVIANKEDHVALENEKNEDDSHGTIRKDDKHGLQRDVEADLGGSVSDEPEPPTQGNNDEVNASTEPSEPVDNARGSEIIDAESQHVADAQHVMIEGYEVKQQQVPEEAKFVPTIWGIDKKRVYQICVLVVAALTIIVGIFFIVLLPKNNLDSENAAPLPLLTGEERAQRRAILVNILSPLNEGRVFDTDGPSSSADRIAALEWLIDDIPSNISNTPDGLVGYYLEWKMIQRYILAVLYFSTNGPGWINSMHFMTSERECEWHAGHVAENKNEISSPKGASFKGVSCNKKSWQIQGIDLNMNNAVGTIPPEISFLNESIKVLKIDFNAFSSTIPSSFGKLSRLTTLGLSHNCLSGDIPEDIVQLPDLLTVKLFGNPMLTGNLHGVCNGAEHKHSADLGWTPFIGIDCPGCMESESLVECDCCKCFDSNTFTTCYSKGGRGPANYASGYNLHWSKEECTMNENQLLWAEENCPCFGYKGVCSTDC
mmetsp:Transcript_24615/g.47155  ORF Transcript_24615/g.47155 Transcript_24615/m.47155 type:complete len:550 (-) Transcript_24615:101-1750(-)